MRLNKYIYYLLILKTMTRRISLVRPSDAFRLFEESVSDMLKDFGVGAIAHTTNIQVNVKEYDDRFEIDAKVPGFSKDEINVGFEDNTLVIELNKSESKEEKEDDGTYYMKEFSCESYRRSIALPNKVDTDKAEAELKNGVMKIKLPKLPETLPKKISIKD